MTLTLDYQYDWKSRLRSRIYEQFKEMPVVEGISDIFAGEVQQLEDAFQHLLSLSSIDDSTGAQLQVIGRRVGQPYTGEDEPTYRKRLKARIRANRSSGTGDDLVAVFDAVLGLSGTGHVAIVPLNPGTQVVVRSLEEIDSATATVIFDLLSSAKLGGVRLVFEWPIDADAFVLDDDGGLVEFGATYAADDAAPTAGGDLAGSLST